MAVETIEGSLSSSSSCRKLNSIKNEEEPRKGVRQCPESKRLRDIISYIHKPFPLHASLISNNQHSSRRLSICVKDGNPYILVLKLHVGESLRLDVGRSKVSV